jgi:dienelactone hydrolase
MSRLRATPLLLLTLGSSAVPAGWAAAVLAGAALAAGCGSNSEAPFDYDDGAPLDVRAGDESAGLVDALTSGDVRVASITYRSPKGGRVPALLFVPSREAPHAGLVVQHGMPGEKDDVALDAMELARLGAVVVAIDAPFARREGEPVAFTPRDREEQVQLIIDLRRAVDLLQSRSDVDPDRIGYLGYSYGGAMGGLLAGVEDRIAAFVLMVGDGGLVEHASGPDEPGLLSSLEPKRRKEWLDAMNPIEPLTWIKQASAPLLLLSGRHDQLVPPRDAARYQRAAPEPKQIRWYDSDHHLPPRAWCDAARFLGTHIGIDGNRHLGC